METEKTNKWVPPPGSIIGQVPTPRQPFAYLGGDLPDDAREGDLWLENQGCEFPSEEKWWIRQGGSWLAIHYSQFQFNQDKYKVIRQ